MAAGREMVLWPISRPASAPKWPAAVEAAASSGLAGLPRANLLPSLAALRDPADPRAEGPLGPSELVAKM